MITIPGYRLKCSQGSSSVAAILCGPFISSGLMPQQDVGSTPLSRQAVDQSNRQSTTGRRSVLTWKRGGESTAKERLDGDTGVRTSHILQCESGMMATKARRMEISDSEIALEQFPHLRSPFYFIICIPIPYEQMHLLSLPSTNIFTSELVEASLWLGPPYHEVIREFTRFTTLTAQVCVH